MDLAELIREAIATHYGSAINADARKWSDRPLQIEFSWMPGMQKLDLVVRSIDRLPSFHAKQPDQAA